MAFSGFWLNLKVRPFPEEVLGAKKSNFCFFPVEPCSFDATALRFRDIGTVEEKLSETLEARRAHHVHARGFEFEFISLFWAI